MLDFLNQLPMPARYAVIGFGVGFIWLVISLVAGLSIDNAFGALGGLTLGGAIAGWLHGREGK